MVFKNKKKKTFSDKQKMTSQHQQNHTKENAKSSPGRKKMITNGM